MILSSMKNALIIFLFTSTTCFGQPPNDAELITTTVTTQLKPFKMNGNTTIIYELNLLNVTDDSVMVKKLEVINAADSSVIAIFDDIGIIARLHKAGKRVASATIGSGEQRIFYIETTINSNLPIVEGLLHQITCEQKVSGIDKTSIVHGAIATIANEPPVLLGSPVSGGPWVAIHDSSWERGHRRVVYTINGQARIPGRFAIDFMKVDNRGKVSRGDRDLISNWFGYGQEVLAVADGIVSATQNEFPESSTLSSHPVYKPEHAAGNYISIRLHNGQYAFYEHLKPGSVLVKPGQQVRKGEVIAKLGFTGQTTGPHLHFHVADDESLLGSEGVPFIFEKFTLLGAYPDFSVFEKECWKPNPRHSIKIMSEHPASNTVLRFN
jgi:murein DD-endopeptidase